MSKLSQQMMKKLPYILTTFSFGFSCFGLWCILNVLDNLSVRSSQALPQFTQLLVGWRVLLLLLPIPVGIYALRSVLSSKSVSDQNSTAFFACVMTVLPVLFFPVLLGVLLPCVLLMDQAWSK